MEQGFTLSGDVRVANDQIKHRSEARTYAYRAYLSSGLTNLTDGERDTLMLRLDRLYAYVFDPLDVLLYLPHLWSNPGHSGAISAEDVHILDRLRIAQSDFLVFCADYPSFGAGQEFEIAQAMGLNILVFCRRGIAVSRMLLGGAGIRRTDMAATDPRTAVVFYDENDEDSLFADLRSRVVELKLALPEVAADRRVGNFGSHLASLIKASDLSDDELCNRTGFTLGFLQYLRSEASDLTDLFPRCRLPQLGGSSVDVLKYTNPGLWVLQKLANALALPIAKIVPGELLAGAAAANVVTSDDIEETLAEVCDGRGVKVSKFLKLRPRVLTDAVAARASDRTTLRERCEVLITDSNNG